MSKRLDELRRLLTETPGEHLSDETLAEIVTAELAGEDVDNLFAEQFRHLESCERCAEAYSALMEAIVAADDEPAARLEAETTTTLWGQPLNITIHAEEHAQRLRLRHKPASDSLTAAPTEEWLLLTQRVGRAPALNVEARARRQSPHLLTLTIQTNPPESGAILREAAEPYQTGAEQPAPGGAGRKIQLEYGGQTVTVVTDENGIATFQDIPISALAALDIVIQEE